jgi:hypothetical protein
MFREALERERQEKERKPAPIEKSPGKALDQGNVLRLSLMKTPQNYYGEQPLSRPESQLQRRTIHYSELPEDKSDGPISREWNFYRREVGRLLAEGNEDRWILIKGEEIVGIWDTEDEAEQVRLQSFLMQAVLLKQICFREPILRAGNHRRWLS